MAILTPWGVIYHCTIEKIGVFRPPGAQGGAGAEIPRFSLLYSGRGVHLGVHLGVHPGTPPGTPLPLCNREIWGISAPWGPGPQGVLNTPYFSIVQWYRLSLIHI